MQIERKPGSNIPNHALLNQQQWHDRGIPGGIPVSILSTRTSRVASPVNVRRGVTGLKTHPKGWCVNPQEALLKNFTLSNWRRRACAPLGSGKIAPRILGPVELKGLILQNALTQGRPVQLDVSMNSHLKDSTTVLVVSCGHSK